MKKLIKRFLRHPVLWSAFACILAGLVYLLVAELIHRDLFDSTDEIFGNMMAAGMVGIFIFFPFALTVLNITFAIFSRRNELLRKGGVKTEIVTLITGVLYSVLWVVFLDEIRWADWSEQLINNEKHLPVASWTLPTVLTFAGLGLAGYIILRCCRISKLPPLVAVFAMAGIYAGAIMSAVWTVQVIKDDFLLALPTINFIIIAFKLICETVADWREGQETLETDGKLRRMVMNSANWPWLALIAAIPLLGAAVAVLTLFGQRPDSIIQAWTQTSDWALSQQVAPQNAMVDEHYLCTVAAGGHERVVKPLRRGKRHGHEVVVNRQLCVANAFEQILEERTPRLHHAVRYVYDKYGFPLSRLIKTKLAADVVWFLMKPLEWLFLAVLYLCDAKPENRIAVQYPHAPLPENVTF